MTNLRSNKDNLNPNETLDIKIGQCDHPFKNWVEDFKNFIKELYGRDTLPPIILIGNSKCNCNDKNLSDHTCDDQNNETEVPQDPPVDPYVPQDPPVDPPVSNTNIVPNLCGNEWSQIINKATNKCFKFVQAENNLVQDECSDDDSFLWMFELQPDGAYTITNRSGSWTSITVQNNSGTNGDTVFTWTKGKVITENTKWIVDLWSINGEFIKFKSSLTNKCISVPEGKSDNNLPLIQYDCLDKDINLGWKCNKTTPKPSPKVIPNYTIRGYIKSATTNLLIPLTTILLKKFVLTFKNLNDQKIYTAQILGSSIYSITLPEGNYERVNTMKQYATASSIINLTESSDEYNFSNTILVSPYINGWRTVLNWNDKIKDIDLYVLDKDNNRIYWKIKENPTKSVYLDVDQRNMYGPETISMENLQPGKYKIYVHNYSKEDLLKNSEAKLSLYFGNDEVDEIRIPTVDHNAKVIYWYIGDIVVDDDLTSSFTVINVLSDKRPR